MEKIYMNETKKQKKQKRGIVNFSVVLSFVVAIFAIFSLTMFGIVSNQDSGVSYAAPDTESFTLKFGKVYDLKNEDGSKNMRVNSYYNGSADSEDNRIFCVERHFDAAEQQYTKTLDPRGGTTDVKNDAGLIYLLGVGYSDRNVGNFTELNDATRPLNKIIVQAAIWSYLAEKYPNVEAYALRTVSQGQDDQAVLALDTVDVSIKELRTEGPVEVGTTAIPGFASSVSALVNEAKSMTAPRITVTKAGGEIAKTDDGKYYQSSLITVNASGSLSGYDISLSGIDGAIAVDENGNELALTNVAAGKKFYVRVPVDKVTETVQNLHIVVNGHFASTSGVYYATSDANLQRLMSVTSGDVSGGLDLEFVGAPNTGMNTAQTIYFIGLIVLLCGVGIVYANAKPVESKQ